GSASVKCDTWIKVEPAGAVCSDGSQYKFFVRYSNRSNNLLVMFEPGGACFDYASCSGAAGVRGAANPHGIPDDHMQTYGILPLLRFDPSLPGNPVPDYNMVFVPYCTGDVHTGNKVATYQNPNGPETITFRHVGHANVLKVVDFLAKTFTSVPKLF